MNRKSFAAIPEFSGDGNVLSKIAQMGVKDHDGDVTLPGFFGEQKAPMIVGHDWTGLAVGKGRVYEQGDFAFFEGQYFVETQHGKDAYLTAKAMAEDQEWSYGYDILKGGASKGTHNGEVVRFLQPAGEGKAGVVVNEVSMVVRGAGVGTQTVDIKDRSPKALLEIMAEHGSSEAKALLELLVPTDEETQGLKFVEQARAVAKAVARLADRAEGIAALPRGIGASSTEALTEVHAELSEGLKVLTSFVVDDAPAAEDLDVEHLRFLRGEAIRNGVELEELTT